MAPVLQSSLRLILGLALFSTCLVSIKMLMRIYEVNPSSVSTVGQIEGGSTGPSSFSSSSRIKIPHQILERLHRQVSQTKDIPQSSPVRDKELLADPENLSSSDATSTITTQKPSKSLSSIDTNLEINLPDEWDWNDVQGWQDTSRIEKENDKTNDNPSLTVPEITNTDTSSFTLATTTIVPSDLPIIISDTETNSIEDTQFIQHEEDENRRTHTDTSTEEQHSSSSSSSSSSLTEGMDPFIGSHEDLAHHQGNTACWEHFDFGMLHSWNQQNKLFCGTDQDKAKEVNTLSPSLTPSTSSWLRCRVTVDSHLPPATAPHTMCDGANIVLDIGKLSPTSCLPSRPGYKCDGPPVHWSYNSGALGGLCTRYPSFIPQAFPRDHLMDMFNSFTAPLSENIQDTQEFTRTSGDTILVIARERGEHANPFHATADFLNAFFILHTTGIVNGPLGTRKGIEKTQVLLLDEQMGPFDDTFIKRVFSPNHPILRVSKLQRGEKEGTVAPASSTSSTVLRGGAGTNANINGKITLLHALFVPPGYTNMLLAHVATEGECHAGTHLFQSFRRFVLSAYNLDSYIDWTITDTETPITVTLISRRPYTTFVEHSFIGRQIDNEDELVKALESVPNVRVTRLDFARISVEEQMTAIATTEVLVAMHGAALTFAMFMPHHGSVVEMWPKDRDMWRCFEHISAMSGLQYGRWENRNPGAFRVDNSGDYTTINIPEFLVLYRGAVDGARKRRGTIIEERKGAELELEKGRGW